MTKNKNIRRKLLTSIVALSTALILNHYWQHSNMSLRKSALVNASIWRQPKTKISNPTLTLLPGSESYGPKKIVTCTFSPDRPLGSGVTPKFYCQTADNEMIKVKYEKNNVLNGEVRSEIVGSRLLNSLGFFADYVHMPKRVRCYGCPSHPFKYILNPDQKEILNFEDYHEFSVTAIEVKLDGRNMEERDNQGWAFSDFKHTAVPAAHVDALKLLLVFLANADVRPANNKLRCPEKNLSREGKYCHKGIAYVHDLGAMLGGGIRKSLKFDAESWQQAPLWSNNGGKQCWIDPPASFSTLKRSQISEEGRKFLVNLLNQLTRKKIALLFSDLKLSENTKEKFVTEFIRRRSMLSDPSLDCPSLSMYQKLRAFRF